MIDDLFENPNPEDYSGIIRSLPNSDLGYAANIRSNGFGIYTGTKWIEAIGKYVDVSDDVVVELGCGRPFALGKELDCKHYVGIDTEIVDDPDLEGHREQSINGSCLVQRYSDKVTVVQADMLCVLSMIKDDSVSVIMNAIDRYVLSKNEKYARAVAGEIQRVTKPGGSVSGFNAYPFNFIEGFDGFLDKGPNGAWAELVKPVGYKK